MGQLTLRLDGVNGLLEDAPQLVLPPVVNWGGVVDSAVEIDLVGVLVGVLDELGTLTMVLGGVTSEEPGTLTVGDTLATVLGGVDATSSTLAERGSSEPVFFGDEGGVPAMVMFNRK